MKWHAPTCSRKNNARQPASDALLHDHAAADRCNKWHRLQYQATSDDETALCVSSCAWYQPPCLQPLPPELCRRAGHGARHVRQPMDGTKHSLHTATALCRLYMHQQLAITALTCLTSKHARVSVLMVCCTAFT
jgi:hypothetical protein